MSGSIQWAQVPDFAGNVQEAQLARQQQNLNALRLMTGKVEYQQNQQFDNALRQYGAGLLSNDPAARQAAILGIGTSGGRQGLSTVMPMVQQERRAAMIQGLLGDAAPAPAAPAGAQPAAAPAGGAASGGGDIAAVVAGAQQRFPGLRITSGDRSPSQNAAVQGAPNSQHLHGTARDIDLSGVPEAQRAEVIAYFRANGVNGMGMYGPNSTSLHVDMRPGAFTAWGPDRTRGSLGQTPAYFQSGIGAPAGAAPAGAARPAGGGQNSERFLAAAERMILSGDQELVATGRAMIDAWRARNPDLQLAEVNGRRVALDPRSGAVVRDIGPVQNVRPESRTIGGRVLQGQVVNERFEPFPGQLPENYRVAADGQSIEPIPGSQAARDRTERPRREDTAAAQQLRTEFTRLTEDYRTIQTAYENAQAAARSNTGQGDMALLYAVVKMLDPTSVVRESEFATAAQTGSFGDRIQGWATRIASGERLPPDVRQGFINEVRTIYGTHERNYQTTERTYRGLAERQNLNPDDVIIPFNRQPERRAAAPAPGGGGGGAGAVPGPTPGSTAEPPARPDTNTVLQDARRAISQGADPAAVRARLRTMNIDPGRL